MKERVGLCACFLYMFVSVIVVRSSEIRSGNPARSRCARRASRGRAGPDRTAQASSRSAPAQGQTPARPAALPHKPEKFILVDLVSESGQVRARAQPESVSQSD